MASGVADEGLTNVVLTRKGLGKITSLEQSRRYGITAKGVGISV